MTYTELKIKFTELFSRTGKSSIKPRELLTLITEIIDKIFGIDVTATATIRKSYDTFVLANADKNPVDPETNKLMKIGQLVTVVSDADVNNNAVYRLVSLAVDGAPTWERQAALGDMAAYAKQTDLAQLAGDAQLAIEGVLKKTTNNIIPIATDGDNKIFIGWDSESERPFIYNFNKLLFNSIGLDELKSDAYNKLKESDALSLRVANYEKERAMFIEPRPETRKIVMQADKTWESKRIGILKVVKDPVTERRHVLYMAWDKDTDYSGAICYAYFDGEFGEWIKEVPGRAVGEDNKVINRNQEINAGWSEFDFIYEPSDVNYPWRMVYQRLDTNPATGILKAHPHIAKAQNPWGPWTEIRRISWDYHDAQFSIIRLDNGNYYLYSRMSDRGWRSLGVQTITRDGVIVTSIQRVWIKPYDIYTEIYNSAATKLADERILLLPSLWDKVNKSLNYVAWKDEASELIISHGQDITDELHGNDKCGFSMVAPGIIQTGFYNEHYTEYWAYYYKVPDLHPDVGDPEAVADADMSAYFYREKIRVYNKNKHFSLTPKPLI